MKLFRPVDVPGAFGVGIRPRIASAVGFRRLGGIWLPGKAIRRYWPLVSMVVSGS